MVSTEKGVRAIVAAIEKEKPSAAVPALPWAPVRGAAARPAAGAQEAGLTSRAARGAAGQVRGRAAVELRAPDASRWSGAERAEARASTTGVARSSNRGVAARQTPGARAPECPADEQRLEEQPDQAGAVGVEAEGVGAGDVLADVAGEDEPEEHSHDEPDQRPAGAGREAAARRRAPAPRDGHRDDLRTQRRAARAAPGRGTGAVDEVGRAGDEQDGSQQPAPAAWRAAVDAGRRSPVGEGVALEVGVLVEGEQPAAGGADHDARHRRVHGDRVEAVQSRA